MDNYILIGDSLTFGYGVRKSENWVSKLRETTSYTLVNKGVNGNTTTDMLFRFTEDVIAKKPCGIFIMGGTNDLLCNNTVESITGNIELMIKEGLSLTDNITIGIPPCIIEAHASKLFMPSLAYKYCNDALPLLREKLIELCGTYNIKFIDFFTLTSTHSKEDIFNDGIHLNSYGQKLLFEKAKEEELAK